MFGMWNLVNLLTLQYKAYSKIPVDGNLYHIETSQAICYAMQINWMVLGHIRSLTQQGLDFF